jgi:hypothetical protein
MVPRKYKRLIDSSVSVPPHQPIGVDDKTESPNWETQDSPAPITGLDAQSSPTTHDLHVWPSQSTLRAQQITYKRGVVMTIGMQFVYDSIVWFTYILTI